MIKTGSAINSALQWNSTVPFEASSTGPEPGTTICYLDTAGEHVLVWYDGSSLSPAVKYYAGGVTDGGGGKLILNADSSEMFSTTRRFTSIDLSYFDASKVTNTSKMFYGCSTDLTTILVNDTFDFTSVTTSTNMFSSSATNLKGGLGTSFNTGKTDASYARVDGGETSPGYFTGPKHLKTGEEINIILAQLNYSATSLERSSSAPSGISASDIKYLDYGEENYPIWASGNIIYYYTGAESKLLMNPNASKFFESCTYLASIDLSGFDFSKVTNMDSTFKSMTHIATLDLSGLDTSKVKSMQSTFYGCSALTSINLNINTSSLEKLSTTFAICSLLTEIDLSSWDLSKVTNMNQTFYNADALVTIYVKAGTVMNSSLAGAGTFTGCTNLKGGEGTTFAAGNNDYTYAHIDGGSASPGYFTAK